MTQNQTANVPPARMQPIAAQDVAAAVADVAVSAPTNGIIEIAGPEVEGQDALVRQLFQATGDARTVVTDPKATYFGAAINDQSLTPTPGAKVRVGNLRFADWLKTAKP